MENERANDATIISTAGLVLSKEKDTHMIKTNDIVRIEYVTSNGSPQNSPKCLELLDTLREPFTVEPRMIYGNFAQLFPYDTIRCAEGKRQTAMLRQLAHILEPTGRELFYYSATPPLWKTIRPTEIDETISSVTQRLWMFLPGHMKKRWKMESARTKKLLGDGHIDGLERLQLDGDSEEVWKLHQMTKEAMKVHDVKKASDRTSDVEDESSISSMST